MARLKYGLSGGDVIAQVTDDDGDFGPATATFTAWDSFTMDNQLTDLLDMQDSAITEVVPDEFGRPIFQGPDDYTGAIFLWDGDGDHSPWQVFPENLADRGEAEVVTDHGELTGLGDDDHSQYHTDARGDARYYTKTQADAQEVRLTGNQTIAGTKTFTSAPSVPDASFSIGKTSGLQSALDAKVSADGSIRSHSDVDDAALNDGDIYRYSGDSNALVGVDPETLFAPVDPSDQRLPYVNAAKYTLFGAIINEGDTPPADLPLPSLVFTRPSAPSIIPTFEGGGKVTADNDVVFQNAEEFAIGDDLILVVGASGEATFPATFTLTIESPGVAPQTLRVSGQQSGSCQANIYQGKVTTAIPAGSDLTVTCTGGNRVQLLACAIKAPNLAASNPFDQSATLNAGSSGNLALTVGPTSSPIAQADELGILAVVFNTGTGSTTRTIAGTNGWTQLYNDMMQSSGGGRRTLYVGYKVFNSVGQVSGTALITASDSATGAVAGALATFKAA